MVICGLIFAKVFLFLFNRKMRFVYLFENSKSIIIGNQPKTLLHELHISYVGKSPPVADISNVFIPFFNGF